MELIIISIIILISLAGWILRDEHSIQLEISDLAKLIDKLEQERELMKLVELERGRSSSSPLARSPLT